MFALVILVVVFHITDDTLARQPLMTVTLSETDLSDPIANQNICDTLNNHVFMFVILAVVFHIMDNTLARQPLMTVTLSETDLSDPIANQNICNMLSKHKLIFTILVLMQSSKNTMLHKINEAQHPDIKNILRFLQSSVSMLQFTTHALLQDIPEMFI